MSISLKWKIQLWHTLILAVVLACLGTGFYNYVKQQKIQELDRWLDHQIAPIGGAPIERTNRRTRNRRASEVTPPVTSESNSQSVSSGDALGSKNIPSPLGWEQVSGSLPSIAGKTIDIEKKPQPPRDRFVEYFVPKGFYAIVTRVNNGDLEFKTSNAPDIELPQGHRRSYYVRFREERYREILYSGPVRNVLIGADVKQFQATLLKLKLTITGCSLAILIFGIGIGHLLIARSLRPIKTIVQTTQKITRGDLSQRIPSKEKSNTTEFLALTDDLNQTFDELEFLFDRQRRFTADASHELRTPLTALLAQLEHGQDSHREPEELSHVIEVSARSAERIRRITEQLVELAHYDTKRVELDYTEMPMTEFLESLVEELAPYASKSGSKITTDIKPGNIECDPFRIHQVITNLVNNALQHNSEPILITLRAQNQGSHTSIEITDNGKGIQTDNIGKLFDRFYQENRSRTKHNGRHNIGLGLSICQAIVDAHRGSIEVTSAPSIATTFSIKIPRS